MGYLNGQPQDDYLLAATADHGTSQLAAPTAWEGTGQAVAQGLGGAIASLDNTAMDFSRWGQSLQPSWVKNSWLGLIPSPLNIGFEANMQNAMGPEANARIAQDREALEKWVNVDKQYQGSAAQYAGGTIKGLATFAPSLLAGPAAPAVAAALMGGTAADDTYRQAAAEGVDSTTAKEMAAEQGIIGAAGAVVPFKFGNVFSRVAGSAAINAGLDLTGRTANWATLKANGYDNMAAAQKPLDMQAMTAAAIIGAAMGVGAHFHETVFGSREPLPVLKRPPPDEVDIAQALANQAHVENSAPGVPIDPETASVHAQAFARFLHGTLGGKEPELAIDEARALSEGTIDSPAIAQHVRDVGEWADSYPEVRDANEMGAMLDEARANLDREYPDFAALRDTAAPDAEALGNEGAGIAPSGMATPDAVDDAHLRQLEATNADEPIPQGDGTTLTVREMAASMRSAMANAEQDNRILAAVAGCFASTGIAL